MINNITTKAELASGFAEHKQAFTENSYPSRQQRVANLKALKSLVIDNKQAFVEAMSDDFGYRSVDDSIIGDILTTVMGINYALKRVKRWMKPEKRHVGVLFQPAKARIMYQPKGVIGIIVPWNYPLFLSLGPLTTALAGGNVAMVKMSEFTPKTNALLAELISQCSLKDAVSIVQGEAEMAANFSQLAFDHLFYTGSTNVGRLVMKAAAENLVPVTLELGGKSPAIIADDINIDTAASRFILGKTLNAGQTCVAPDYVFCPRDKVDDLVVSLKARYQAMYPCEQNYKDSTCVVTDAQFTRINRLLSDAEEKGATIIKLSSEHESAEYGPRQMPLTVVLNTHDDMLITQQEIFGPLLPILPYDNIDETIAYVNNRPRPLALYIYSFNKAIQNKILLNTHAGGVCVNEATFHVTNDDLPFGGIGDSGMGSYHGIEGFKTFSHAKSIFSRGRISVSSLLFPPFGGKIHQLVYKLFIR